MGMMLWHVCVWGFSLPDGAPVQAMMNRCAARSLTWIKRRPRGCGYSECQPSQTGHGRPPIAGATLKQGEHMYKNLLVPTDGSALSHRTIRDAAKLAAKLGAKITGFYVAPTYHIEVYTDFVPPDMMTPDQHKTAAKKTAQRHLEVVRKAAADNGVACDADYALNDNPAEAIIKAAHKHKCDLIYMGSHGRSGISKLLLGSQTSKVLAHSRLPVLVHR
jgi:nucleotide-binding universal stress UspA family protein